MKAQDYDAAVLNRLLRRYGGEKVKARFSALASAGGPAALAALNSETLHFGVLFVLYPEINRFGLYGSLAPRPGAALRFCEDVLAERPVRPPEESVPLRAALPWMLQTGWRDDGLSDEYDRVLDAAALLMTRSLGDGGPLPELTRMAFRRNRRRHYLHDLVWALFGVRDPRLLELIAPYLDSPDRRDRAFAAQLLRDSPEPGTAPSGGRSGRYRSWLRENRPYLVFTDESFLEGSDPVFYRVDLDSKYLCRRVSAGAKKPEPTGAEGEKECLQAYRGRKTNERELLAGFSARLRGKSPARWEKWIEFPVERQLEIAKKSRRGGNRE